MDHLELKRKIESLSHLLNRVQARLEKQFGHSQYCVLGNDREHERWRKLKLNEEALLNQDDQGRELLPTWDKLSEDLYSALRRIRTILFDENQIAPKYLGNRKLLSSVIEIDDYERIHDTTLGDDNMCVIAALKIQDGWLEELKKQKKEEEEKNEQSRTSGGSGSDEGSSGSKGEEPGDRSSLQGSGTGSPGVQGATSDGMVSSELQERGGSDFTGNNPEESDTGQDEGSEDGYRPVPEPHTTISSCEAGIEAEEALKAAVEAAQRLVNSQEQQDLEEALRQAEEALDKAENASKRLQDQAAYDDLMKDVEPPEAIKKAIKEAAQELKEQAELLHSWGIEQGTLKQMDPKGALALSKKLRESRDLQKIAELIGNNRLAMQRRKTRDQLAHGPTLRIGIEHGQRLNKLVNSQKLQMVVAPKLFQWNFLNKNLRQFKTRMEQVQERGTGVLWIDSSGSMWQGSPYTYSQVAKAAAISMMEYFREEGRYCVVGLFDHGVREVLDIPPDIPDVEFLMLKLKIAEDNFGGGTDFFAPLMAGFVKIKESQYLESCDQILLSDGQCYLSDEQVKQIKELQDETRTNIISVLMPGGYSGQLSEFGPVHNIRTALNEVSKLALDIVTKMDEGYDKSTS